MGVTPAMEAAVVVAAVDPVMITARRMQARMEARNLVVNVKLLTWSLGLFAAVSFLVCVAYGLIVPEALHMHAALESVLPGFRWLSFGGFFLGLLESFLYGIYGGLVFGWIHNALWKRWGRTSSADVGLLH